MFLIYCSTIKKELREDLFLGELFGNELNFLWGKKESSASNSTDNSSSSNNNNLPNSNNNQEGTTQIQNSERQPMNKQQPKGKMKIVKVKPDGNCLFRAISMGLYGTESKHMDVRYMAVDWMRKNLDTKIEGCGETLEKNVNVWYLG
ncbi:predicted protein [Naegleria gruberi]|uniref:Predicted protein n=1 Tax=Naegleria gruberi TaxID=5762 RepID=D2VQI6_NAEGR|nr:uncharacterized protein NAEGRDRAFT_71238 [Naegleria gruberi]EFC40956.1 predicted protein [Naegleria gruberi]|eukprot:XP_002673700.1 predicted protein [Naegleria gruberi strain NEG-M]